jgi:hypothetical protein
VIKPRRIGWTGHVARLKKMRNAYKTVTGKPVRKTALEGVSCR